MLASTLLKLDAMAMHTMPVMAMAQAMARTMMREQATAPVMVLLMMRV